MQSVIAYSYFDFFLIFVAMDFQFWLYVIIGVIYFLSRVLKKQEPQPSKENRTPPPSNVNDRTRPTEVPKQLTFEELLKQITEAKEAPKPVSVPEPSEVVVDYDDELVDEAQDLEDVEYDYRKRDKLYEEYEEGKRAAFNRASLEETLRVQDTEVKFEKFKVFQQEKQRNLLEEYTRDFHDPEGLKKAFVMSEILNRKF
jgi:hypothetical protein